MIFFIKKLDKNDKKISYFDTFEDIEDAIEFIEKEGSIPLTITPLPKYISIFIAPFLKPKIKKEEIIEILENFYLIIKSGIPIQTAIEDMIKENNNKFIKKMLKNISINLQKGTSFSDALAKYTKYFSKFIISLIKIGEQTGNLEHTLKNGAEFLKNIEDLKKKFKQALIYPTFAFISIFFSMMVWLLYVLPKIIDFFKQLNMELPTLTYIVMKISEFMQEYFLWMFLGFLVFLIIFIFSLRYDKVKYYFDKFMLKTPLVNKFIIYFNSAFFAEYLKLTLSSGLPIIDGLKTLKENTSNKIFKEAIDKILNNIQKGYSISEALKDAKLYPLFMERMITIGEDTGELENQLNLISEYYYSKMNYLAQNLSKIIEPTLLILLAIFITIIMLSIFGPLYSLIGGIKV